MSDAYDIGKNGHGWNSMIWQVNWTRSLPRKLVVNVQIAVTSQVAINFH